MSQEIILLAIAAASIGFLHTLLGPDHYVPFVVMSKAWKWSLSRTCWITTLCGIGHILGSVLLGVVGISLGVAVGHLEFLEAIRGEIAAWILISFGLVYFTWGLKRSIKHRKHKHKHTHQDGTNHDHKHKHINGHSHVHTKKGAMVGPWTLFVFFVLGPCEPLIPILIYPAAKESLLGILLVIVVFGVVTVMTMLSIVVLMVKGLLATKEKMFPKLARIEKYKHTMAGGIISLCGLAILSLGI